MEEELKVYTYQIGSEKLKHIGSLENLKRDEPSAFIIGWESFADYKKRLKPKNDEENRNKFKAYR